jgi:DNA replication and repair protein RecF
MKEDSSLREGTVERRRFGLCHVSLRAFRNYRKLYLEFDRGFNVLTGENAQGKTNLLEAMALLSTSRLLRGQKDSEAILDGERTSCIEGELLESHTELAVHLERGVRKRVFLNGLVLPRAGDLIGRLPCVCMTTEDMAIARGEPSNRRLFLDLDLSALYPAYFHHLALYKRALEQRNALLRQAEHFAARDELFDPWEEQLATHGSEIRRLRRHYIAALATPAASIHAQMGNGEMLNLAYAQHDALSDQEGMRMGLASGRAVDLHRGGTGIGPHRDDLSLTIDGKDLRSFGSQGQQRTAVIALKLGVLQVEREELGASPLLLLDDMLSDLDEHRRSLLVEAVLESAGQAVLTCTEASAAGVRILREASVFEVKAGTVARI